MLEHKVTIYSPKMAWVVFLELADDFAEVSLGLSDEQPCCKCGATECDTLGVIVHYTAKIVEMYDENGIDVAPNAKVYRFAKKALRADGEEHPYCWECRFPEEIEYDSSILETRVKK